MGKKYWTFETFKSGLKTCWKDYQVVLMQYLWGLEEGEGAGSGKAWVAVNKVLKKRNKSISRASIIFFLNDMVDEGVLKFSDATGKGGHHRIYAPLFDETGFNEYLAKKIIGKLMLEFPDETKKVVFGVQKGSS